MGSGAEKRQRFDLGAAIALRGECGDMAFGNCAGSAGFAEKFADIMQMRGERDRLGLFRSQDRVERMTVQLEKAADKKPKNEARK